MSNLAQIDTKFISTLTTTFCFIGDFDKSRKYKCGDTCIKDGQPYVYTGSSWEYLGVSNDTCDRPKSIHIKPRLCTQCGARLTGRLCEWCGTEYVEQYA